MLKFKPRTTYDPITFEATKGKPTSALVLRSTIGEPLNFKNNKNTEYDLHENFNYQNAVVYNRHRSELVPVNLARRLLRTKRTLVLPAHTNITLITNSYDVVHS
jgi:heme/copper-type cytochrome/quinol oxidase subunit 2